MLMLQLLKHRPIVRRRRLGTRSERRKEMEKLLKREFGSSDVVFVGDLHPDEAPQQTGAAVGR